MTIKALTLHQPWASLVIGGYKCFETRSWSTDDRGLIAIHAGNNRSALELTDIKAVCYHFEIPLSRSMPFGSVLGICRLVNIYSTESLLGKISEQERRLGDFSKGRFGWQMQVLHKFDTPVPMNGQQGLWEYQHTCELYTAQMRVTDTDAIDTTIKSADTPEGKAFAPRWDMVMESKRGELADGEYDTRYYKLLGERYKQDPTPFLKVLARPRVVLKCYCAHAEGCHRGLLVDILQKIGAVRGVDVVYGGEILHEKRAR